METDVYTMLYSSGNTSFDTLNRMTHHKRQSSSRMNDLHRLNSTIRIPIHIRRFQLSLVHLCVCVCVYARTSSHARHALPTFVPPLDHYLFSTCPHPSTISTLTAYNVRSNKRDVYNLHMCMMMRTFRFIVTRILFCIGKNQDRWSVCIRNENIGHPPTLIKDSYAQRGGLM